MMDSNFCHRCHVGYVNFIEKFEKMKPDERSQCLTCKVNVEAYYLNDIKIDNLESLRLAIKAEPAIDKRFKRMGDRLAF